jgi:hypothetical protein
VGQVRIKLYNLIYKAGSSSEGSANNDEITSKTEEKAETKLDAKLVEDSPNHLRNLDIHFFSDTEVAGPR